MSRDLLTVAPEDTLGEAAERWPAEAWGLIEAAQRLGEMLRSDNLETAIWADEVIKWHILPETSKHTSGLAGWYKPEPEN